jgi:hypothetical protein
MELSSDTQSVNATGVHRCTDKFAQFVCINPDAPKFQQRFVRNFLQCTQSSLEHSKHWHRNGDVQWQVSKVLAPDRKLRRRKKGLR